MEKTCTEAPSVLTALAPHLQVSGAKKKKADGKKKKSFTNQRKKRQAQTSLDLQFTRDPGKTRCPQWRDQPTRWLKSRQSRLACAKTVCAVQPCASSSTGGSLLTFLGLQGKQWHALKKAFRPTRGLSSYEQRTKERAAMAQMKAKEKEMKEEKEEVRQVCGGALCLFFFF